MSTAAVDVDEQLLPPASRWDFKAGHEATTKADLGLALELAQTPAEVDQAAHLSLVLFDVAGTMTVFRHRGRFWPSLHQLTFQARRRVDGFAPQARALSERMNAIAEDAAAIEKRRRTAAHNEREARIHRVGFSNAIPPTSRSPR